MATTTPKKKQVSVKIQPGDPLPKGIYLNGWKLEVSRSNGGSPRSLYLIIEPEESIDP